MLVHESDLPKAADCLEQEGFSRKNPEPLDDYSKFFANSPGFAGNKVIALYSEGGDIDLHWELSGSGLRTEDILARSVTAISKGCPIPIADPADCLLLTVLHHAIRENLAIESVCRDRVDVGRWCGHLLREGHIESTTQRSVEAGDRFPYWAFQESPNQTVPSRICEA